MTNCTCPADPPWPPSHQSGYRTKPIFLTAELRDEGTGRSLDKSPLPSPPPVSSRSRCSKISLTDAVTRQCPAPSLKTQRLSAQHLHQLSSGLACPPGPHPPSCVPKERMFRRSQHCTATANQFKAGGRQCTSCVQQAPSHVPSFNWGNLRPFGPESPRLWLPEAGAKSSQEHKRRKGEGERTGKGRRQGTIRGAAL